MADVDFLGVGWRFPVQLETVAPGRAQTALARYEDSVRQSIWIILSTAPGERLMRPDFGCGIHDLVFAVNSTRTAALAAEAVRQALIRWEPRIHLLNVRAVPDDTGAVLYLHIDYQIRTTNTTFNLVYPFYLTGEAGR